MCDYQACSSEHWRIQLRNLLRKSRSFPEIREKTILNRKLPFEKVVAAILSFQGGTLNRELMDFFDLNSASYDFCFCSAKG